MRLVVTRPEEDAGPLADRLRAMGHDVIVEPMLTISIDAAVPIPPGPWRAIVVTSANALRALAGRAELPMLLETPVLTVGLASAEAARATGFAMVTSADGDLDALADLVRERIVPGEGPLLYPTGKQISGDLAGMLGAEGFEIERVVLYEAVPAIEPSPALAAALASRKIDGVVLFSRRTAKIWCAVARNSGVDRALERVTHYCLSRAVAEVLEDECEHTPPAMIAGQPETESLLRLLRR